MDVAAAEQELKALWCRACAAAAREVAARSFDITPDQILSASRGRAHIALARQVAMYMAHVICSISVNDIAVLFRRDRTTISYACKRVEDMRDDHYFDAQLEQLELLLEERMDNIRRTQLHNQQALLLQEKKSVVGGPDQATSLLRTANGRLLEFKPFR